jgi:hypothetical protein
MIPKFPDRFLACRLRRASKYMDNQHLGFVPDRPSGLIAQIWFRFWLMVRPARGYTPRQQQMNSEY